MPIALGRRRKRVIITMKKEHILYYAIFASFLVSLVSLGISVPRNPEDLGIDYLGVIVGILSVLVTVLVGLQLYNYIYAQENIKQIVNQQGWNLL